MPYSFHALSKSRAVFDAFRRVDPTMQFRGKQGGIVTTYDAFPNTLRYSRTSIKPNDVDKR